MVAWHQMYQAAHGTDERRPFSRATLGRIGRFARPHRRRIGAFLALSVLGAVLAVATPVLAGRVVDAIVGGGPTSVVVGIALAHRGHRDRGGRARDRAALAVGDARRGADPRPAHRGVRPRAAHAGRVLHPHPHRRAGQPAQQRRDRRAAGVQRHAVRRGRQRRHAGADAGRDARRCPGRSPCWRWSCCRCSCCPARRMGRRLAAAASARPPTTTRRWAPR